ncbi:hypothetical protein Aph01nite_52540 [Acrocarpospora phusangensis]|uniref:Secreted protein n=1 Tax=Acrocarpospora phusangensis TaxID=1070424 RepID=A0A919UMG5_9ACTN|nr:hypothetical protein [Acrocarpospora phusangensis]GIH26944.1 hypothetical protein Aph01nite_52540 [Acrocarpospora phusangensis]
MRVRQILGATAATAILAFGAIGLTSTPASAAPTTSAKIASADWDYDDDWGSYWSWNHKAKAKGWIEVEYDHHEDNKVEVGGKVYDKDHRNSKCGYVKFRSYDWDGGKWDWDHVWGYKACGWDKPFHFTKHDIAKLQVQVCQINKWGGAPFKCGQWKTIYDAWDHDYGYDWDHDHDDHDDHDEV